ncbi:hypothetical protein GA0070607_5149 [Micromonospora coriariae]|uniref:Uncharacterized protein n=1 Tax=Micromonospora coriariae TaxID=285665 RepID=A0A1C4XEN9_9ACTN|nr:hypothetical protein GA0070607_5149 [Micromonospora coriariae]
MSVKGFAMISSGLRMRAPRPIGRALPVGDATRGGTGRLDETF